MRSVSHELLELGVQCCLLLLGLRVIGRVVVIVIIGIVIKIAAMSTRRVHTLLRIEGVLVLIIIVVASASATISSLE